MAALVWTSAIATLAIAATLLPFAPGGHDPLAVPLGATAWALGRVGLLLVPVGALWLLAARRVPPASGPAAPGLAAAGLPLWLVRITLGACILIAGVMTIVSFAVSGSPLLAIVAALFGGSSLRRLQRHLQARRRVGATPEGSRSRSTSRATGAILMIAPMVVLLVQSRLVDTAAARARDRAIANSAPLIAEIEEYRARRGGYPESLFSIWGDVKPEVVGMERYHYERSGEAYNVIIEEPSLAFGTRRFLVYNPRDRQRVTVHEQDRLRLDEAGLDADNAGHTVIDALAPPHWKAFLFLS